MDGKKFKLGDISFYVENLDIDRIQQLGVSSASAPYRWRATLVDENMLGIEMTQRGVSLLLGSIPNDLERNIELENIRLAKNKEV